MNISDLNGKALNWAIAKCEGYDGEAIWLSRQSSASTDWEQAGQIIERERITIDASQHGRLWVARKGVNEPIIGPTPLIAAMRCYVASKLGNELDIPAELEGK